MTTATKTYDDLTVADARDDLFALMKWNESMEVGERVEVRWTSSGYSYAATGTLVKKNACSARVELDRAVTNGPDGDLHYPAGAVITQNLANMRTMLRWSWSNSILPLPDIFAHADGTVECIS
jgi:hypothetical protein